MTTIQELREHFVVTGLEEQLKSDTERTELVRIENEIDSCLCQVEAKKRGGLPPEDFYRVERLLSSLRVAKQVVRRTWFRHHSP